jgi:hypothetical protein
MINPAVRPTYDATIAPFFIFIVAEAASTWF